MDNGGNPLSGNVRRECMDVGAGLFIGAMLYLLFIQTSH